MKKYILNPLYTLIKETNRILLMSSNDEGDNLVVSFIHPMYALILSKFTGEKETTEIIETLSERCGVSREKIYPIIEQFIDNSPFSIKYDGYTFSFPENVLVKNTKEIIRDDLKTANYYIYPPYDFETKRLEKPKTILFVLNLQCKTDCIYCYANRRVAYKPLTTSRILALIEEAALLGVRRFDLSGGEVLLHKDWEVIVKKLIDYNLTPYISTKIPIGENTILKLRKMKLKEIQFSLDCADASILSRTLHISETYLSQMKKSIRLADEYGLDIIIKSTLTKETCTIREMRQLFAFFKTIRNLRKYTFTPVGYSQYKPIDEYDKLKPTLKEIEEVIEDVERNNPDIHFLVHWDMGAIHYREEYKSAEEFSGRAFCTGNMTGLTILPDGKVTLCEELYWNENLQLGDLTKQSIEEVWNSHRAKTLAYPAQQEFPQDSYCRICPDFVRCRYKRGVCWKEVIAFYGKENWLYPDPRCPKAPDLNETNKKLIYEKV